MGWCSRCTAAQLEKKRQLSFMIGPKRDSDNDNDEDDQGNDDNCINNGNDGADAAGIYMMRMLMVTTVAMMGRMQPA